MNSKRKIRIKGMLGFAMRAGKLVFGVDQICAMMGKGKIKLVVISKSASENTALKLEKKCGFYNIPSVRIDMDTESLGQLLGKSYAPAGVGVSDGGFAELIKSAVLSETTL